MSDIKNMLELSELLVRLLEGTISDEQFAYLQHQLASNPHARRYYLRYMKVSSALSRLGQITNVDTLTRTVAKDTKDLSILEKLAEYEKSGKPVEVERVKAKVEPVLTEQERQAKIRAFIAEQQAMEEQEKLLEQLERRRIRQRELRRRQRIARARTVAAKVSKVSRIGAMAAVGMVIAYLLYLVSRPVPPAFVAVLTDGIDVKWADHDLPTEPDSLLRPGYMKLVAGIAEITFDGGAKAIIQAPVEIKLQNASRAYLQSGKMSATVPVEARGFALNTPSASIVDLGTEFAVHVNEDGSSDIYVFKGRVSLLAGKFGEIIGRLYDTVEQIVEAGQAKRVYAGSSRIRDIQFGQSAFVRDMPSPYELAVRQSRPTGYWRFGSDNRKMCVNSIDSVRHVAKYVGSIDCDNHGPGLGDAKPNDAMKLDGRPNNYMLIENITSRRPQNGGSSLVLWLRADEVRDQSIITNETAEGQAEWFSRYLYMEKTGRFAFIVFSDYDEIYEGETVETSLIRSKQMAQKGRWYHLAITLSRKHVCLFIDGRLEAEAFDPIEQFGDIGLSWYLCTRANISPTDEDDAPPIKGAIDELAIYDRALSAEEIKRLYSVSQQ